MTTYVYTGPTLAPSEAARLSPAAVIRPPVRHGDLLELQVCPSDRVVIIDGFYHHSAAVRHKEILYLMARGVEVLGAASMGALRAAELSSFGMRGVGHVYRLYSEGVIDGDDEVAVAHTEDLDFTRFSEPLVNIRYLLQLSQEASLLDGATAGIVLEVAATIPYPQRSRRALAAALPPTERAALDRALDHLRRDGVDWDVKRLDAIEALTETTAASPSSSSFNPGREWRTRYLADWILQFSPHRADPRARRADVWDYGRLYGPDFPRRWRAYVLRQLGLDTSRPADALRALGAPTDLEKLRHWASDTEVSTLPLDDLLVVAAVRAWLPPADLTVRTEDLDGLVGDLKSACDAAIEAHQLNDELSRRDRTLHPLHVKRTVILRYLASLWSISVADLELGARDRGFASLGHAEDAARKFFLRSVSLAPEQARRLVAS